MIPATDTTKNGPSVTCVIGAYNHAAYVEEALESAFAQTYSNLRIVIFDDASTDNTQQVIRNYLSSNGQDHVPFIAHHANLGLCASLNEVLAGVDTDYVAIIAADDIQEHDRLEKQVAVLEELGHEFGVCYSDMLKIDPTGAILAESYFASIGIPAPPSGDIYDEMLRHMVIAAPSALIRTSVLRTAGPYDEDLAYEDYDMFLRISRFSKFAYIPDRTVRYRIVHDSMWRELVLDKIKLLTAERAVVHKHVGASGNSGRIAALRVAELTKQLYLLGERPADSAAYLKGLPSAGRRGRTLAYKMASGIGIPGKWLAAPARAVRRYRH